MSAGLLEVGQLVQEAAVYWYQQLQPQFVRLNVSGNAFFVVSEMSELDERLEVGVLRLVKEHHFSEEFVADLGKGEIFTTEAFSSPVSEEVSCLRLAFDKHKLVVSGGEMPFSLYVNFDGADFGRPEYALSDYFRRPVAASIPMIDS